MRWLSEADQQVWRRLLAVECKVREHLDRELREVHGISLGDYDVLVHLSEAPTGSLRMSELAERVLLSRSGITRRLDRLVVDGMVRRTPCADDRRGAMAQITEAGWQRLAAAAPTHVAGVRRYVIDPLGDLAGLADGLERIEKALESGGGV
jgi:DNA-binding MarR family transcriptional regulator